MKKFLICLLICGASMYGGEEQDNLDTTCCHIDDEIHQSVMKMIEHCQNSSDSTQKCLENYSKQLEIFLVRKYTALCAYEKFNETFSYKTTDETQVHDILATSHAYDKWVVPNTRQCDQHCMELFSLRAQVLLLAETESQLKSTYLVGYVKHKIKQAALNFSSQQK